MPVRIYDIAKKLGIESKEVLARAKELGIATARVPSSTLDKITAEYLESHLKPAVTAAPEPPVAPPVPEPIVIVSAPPVPVAPVAEVIAPPPDAEAPPPSLLLEHRGEAQAVPPAPTPPTGELLRSTDVSLVHPTTTVVRPGRRGGSDSAPGRLAEWRPLGLLWSRSGRELNAAHEFANARSGGRRRRGRRHRLGFTSML